MSSTVPSEGTTSTSSTADHPSHGYPDSKQSATPSVAKSSTASHPPRTKPDPTVSVDDGPAKAGLSASYAPSSTELTRLKGSLRGSLKQYPDFPSPGILFEDIMPLFANPNLHADLLRALELQITNIGQTPDVVVGLEARGFLFGPSLALRLGAAFVPVRKKGKLPGECLTAGFKKEYGEDFFQIQNGTIQNGQKVLIVDDIIATGGSAAAAGSLVTRSGGVVMGYIFMLELLFLKGRDKLDAPVYTLLSGQEGN